MFTHPAHFPSALLWACCRHLLAVPLTCLPDCVRHATWRLLLATVGADMVRLTAEAAVPVLIDKVANIHISGKALYDTPDEGFPVASGRCSSTWQCCNVDAQLCCRHSCVV